MLPLSGCQRESICILRWSHAWHWLWCRYLHFPLSPLHPVETLEKLSLSCLVHAKDRWMWKVCWRFWEASTLRWKLKLVGAGLPSATHFRVMLSPTRGSTGMTWSTTFSVESAEETKKRKVKLWALTIKNPKVRPRSWQLYTQTGTQNMPLITLKISSGKGFQRFSIFIWYKCQQNDTFVSPPKECESVRNNKNC